MRDRYRIATAEITMATADTEYSWVVPERARDIEIKMSDTSVAWRWSDRTGVVSTPTGGHPVPAGGAFGDEGVEHGRQTLYFGHSDGSTQTLKIAFNVPRMR